MNHFSITDSIQINAPKEKVWEVLTNPIYIKEWDDIPENYAGGHLELHSVIDWEGYSRLVVTECVKNEKLTLKMSLPKVNLAESAYDVRYRYTITGEDGFVTLSINIGDFAPLPNPQDYLASTTEFVNASKVKIKELAEAQ